MFEKPEVLTIASSLAAHAAARQSAIARNVANADTPGYRAQDLPDFAELYRARDAVPLRTTRAGHIAESDRTTSSSPSDRAGPGSRSPKGHSVSLETEMGQPADGKREHDLALAVYGKLLAMLRAGLGLR